MATKKTDQVKPVEPEVPEIITQPVETDVVVQPTEPPNETSSSGVDNEVVFTGEKEPLKEEVVFEKPISEVIAETKVWGDAPNDEVEFLKKILQIQQEGCFGRHLDAIINERIKTIQSRVS